MLTFLCVLGLSSFIFSSLTGVNSCYIGKGTSYVEYLRSTNYFIPKNGHDFYYRAL